MPLGNIPLIQHGHATWHNIQSMVSIPHAVSIMQFINKFALLSITLEPHPEGSEWPEITPSGHVPSSNKINSDKISSKIKYHNLWGKGRAFPLLNRGFKQHYPFAKVHCIKYVFKCVKKRNKNRNRQLIYYTEKCNL